MKCKFVSLIYQIDTNQQLRTQANNDDILMEISDFAEKLTNQNARIIELLEVLTNAQSKNDK